MGDRYGRVFVEQGVPTCSADQLSPTGEPLPAPVFELQLIGADFRQQKVSVPLWFRPSRVESRTAVNDAAPQPVAIKLGCGSRHVAGLQQCAIFIPLC